MNKSQTQPKKAAPGPQTQMRWGSAKDKTLWFSSMLDNTLVVLQNDDALRCTELYRSSCLTAAPHLPAQAMPLCHAHGLSGKPLLTQAVTLADVKGMTGPCCFVPLWEFMANASEVLCCVL